MLALQENQGAEDSETAVLIGLTLNDALFCLFGSPVTELSPYSNSIPMTE